MTYTISVDPAGGAGGSVSPASYSPEQLPNRFALTDPSRTGYGFRGWTPTAGIIECTASVGSGSVVGDTVTLDGGVVAGTTITAVGLPVSEHALWLGANTTGDVVLTASWSALAYAVTKSGTNCTVRADASGRFGLALQISWAAGTDIGYDYTLQHVKVYSGNDATGTLLATYTSGTSAAFTMSGTYYPSVYIVGTYTKTIATYAIHFDPNGGTGGSASPLTYQMSASAQTISLIRPTRPERGYFTRWKTSAGYVSGDSVILPAFTVGDVYVSAVWEYESRDEIQTSKFVVAMARKGEHNDIGLRNGDFAFAEGKTAYAAILEAAVLTVKGELIYDVNRGVPYFDTAFKSPVYLNVWAANVQDRMRAFDFVEDIESFEYEWLPDEGRVTYAARVKTDAGIVEFSDNGSEASQEEAVTPAGVLGSTNQATVQAGGGASKLHVVAMARKGEHNDIGLRNGDFAFAEGKTAYAAILEAAVLTVKGELIYDVNRGVPYFDTAFKSPIYLKVWAANVQDRMRAFDFVEDIESFEYEWLPDEGRVTYAARVKTDEGEVLLGE